MSQKNKRGLQRGLSEIIEKQTAPLPDKSKESSDLISRFRDQSVDASTSLLNSSSLSNLSKPEFSSPKSDSLPSGPSQAYQIDSLPIPDSLSESGSPKLNEDVSLNLMASLPDVDGYMKFWHQMTDHLYRQLTMAEQAVHMQLFRLSWGHNNPTCIIGLPGLARRTGAAKGTIQTAVAGLIKKGLIRKERTVFGKDKEQGIEYYVVPPPSMSKSGRLSKSSSLPEASTIKEGFKKKDIKGEAAMPDTKNCPDCDGMGVRYIDPLDYSKGTVKCKHEQLTAGK
jgi:hypothetical protein